MQTTTAPSTNDRLAALNLKKGRKIGNSSFEIVDHAGRAVFAGTLVKINFWLCLAEADRAGIFMLVANDLFLEVENDSFMSFQADRIKATAQNSVSALHRYQRLAEKAGRRLMEAHGSNFRGGFLLTGGYRLAAALRIMDAANNRAAFTEVTA